VSLGRIISIWVTTTAYDDAYMVRYERPYIVDRGHWSP